MTHAGPADDLRIEKADKDFFLVGRVTNGKRFMLTCIIGGGLMDGQLS